MKPKSKALLESLIWNNAANLISILMTFKENGECFTNI